MRVNISIFGYIYIKINLLCNRIYYSEIDLNGEKFYIPQITLSNIIFFSGLVLSLTYVAQLHNEDKNQQSPASPCAMSWIEIHGRSARVMNLRSHTERSVCNMKSAYLSPSVSTPSIKVWSPTWKIWSGSFP